MIFKIFYQKSGSSKQRTFVFLFSLALGLTFIDQAAKYFAAVHGFIFRNYLFAFSLPVPSVLMYLFYLVALAVLFWYVMVNLKKFSRPILLGWWLIVVGASINVGERLILGYVRDFIYIYGGGVLNVADLYIIVGIVYLLIYELYSRRKTT